MSDELETFFAPAEVVMQSTAIIAKFDAVDINRSGELLGVIRNVLDTIESGYTTMVRGYARLGVALLEVRTKKFWSLWGFDSFGSYIDSIKDRVDRERTQLYNAITVAQHLLPAGVPEDKLNEMGITRGNILASHVRRTGRLEPVLLEQALDKRVRIAELKAAAFAAENIPESQLEGPGRYFDFGGAYLTDDEREEYQYACSLAERVDPAIRSDVSSSYRTKEIMLRFAREFVSEHGARLGRGEE